MRFTLTEQGEDFVVFSNPDNDFPTHIRYERDGDGLRARIDGEVHELNIQNLLDEGVLTQEDIDAGYVPVGQGSPILELQTVTND